MTASHNDDIVINVTLGAAPVVQAGFGKVLLLVAQASNSLDGDRSREYASASDASTDRIAGFISTATESAVNAALAQRPRPSGVVVGRVDLVGGESYADGFDAVAASRSDTYAVCIDTRTAATQSDFGAAMESREGVYLAQSSDADWLTTGLPASFSANEGAERMGVVYHDTDSEWDDMRWAAKWTVADPDVRSSPAGPLPIKGGTSYATALTAGERTFALANNCNLVQALGPSPRTVSRGRNLAGRPLHEILTADWLVARSRESMARVLVEYGERNEKLPLTPVGQQTVRGELEAVGQIGVEAGHFTDASNYEVTTPDAISAADLDSGTLRASIRGQLANNAVIVNVAADLSRTALADA